MMKRKSLNSVCKKTKEKFNIPSRTPLSPNGDVLTHSGLEFPRMGIKGAQVGKFLVFLQTLNKIFIVAGIISCLQSCIEPYIIHVGQEDLRKYIVSGQVSDQEGYHYVNISLGTSIDDPDYLLLPDCNIVIKDDNNNEFVCEEYEEGMYRVWIADDFLQPGTSFMVNIITSST